MESRHLQPNVQNDFKNSLLLLAKGVRALPPLPRVVLASSEGVPRSANDRKAGGRRQRPAAASSTPSLPPQPQPVQPAPQAGKRRRIAPKLVSADESGAGHIASAPPHPGSPPGAGAATRTNSRADSCTDAAGGSSAACVLVEDSLAFAEGGRGGLSSASQARSRVAGAGEDGACVAQYLFELLSREIMASDGTKVMGVGAGGVPMLQKYLGVLSALDLAVAAAPAKDDALDAAPAAPVGLVGKALSDGLFELLGLFPPPPIRRVATCRWTRAPSYLRALSRARVHRFMLTHAHHTQPGLLPRAPAEHARAVKQILRLVFGLASVPFHLSRRSALSLLLSLARFQREGGVGRGAIADESRALQEAVFGEGDVGAAEGWGLAGLAPTAISEVRTSQAFMRADVFVWICVSMYMCVVVLFAVVYVGMRVRTMRSV